MNIETIFCILGIMLIIALSIGVFSIFAIMHPTVRKINTICFVAACIVVGLLVINFISFQIGKQQEPIVTAEITEQIPIDITSTHYEDEILVVRTLNKDEVQIPDDTVILKPVITVKKLFIRKEWNFIFPFYLEEVKYEYVNDKI